MNRVLLLADEPQLKEDLETMGDWQKYGFAISGTAHRDGLALEVLQAMKPDLVIIDMGKPSGDGLGLIKRIREAAGPQIKILIVSDSSEFVNVQRVMRYDVSNYLLKPIDSGELNRFLAQIGAYFETVNQKRAQQERRLALIVHGALRRLLKGEVKESMLKQVCHILNLTSDAELRGILVEVDADAATLAGPEIRAQKERIKTVVMDSLKLQAEFYLLEVELDRFFLFTTETQLPTGQVNEYIYNLKKNLAQVCDSTVTVAISEKMPGLAALGQIYRQTLEALYYKFYQGENSIIYYSEIKNTPLNLKYCNIQTELLLRDVERNAGERITAKIDEVFHTFLLERYTPEVIKAFIKNFELEIIKLALTKHGEYSGGFLQRLFQYNRQIELGTFEKIKTDFEQLCLYLGTEFAAFAPNGPCDTINDVKTYIKQNYNKDINLQKVAKEFFMNPAYLGQLFKRYTGMQYNQYLHQTRIEAAKKLLRRTNMKIYEIAQAIGYHDPDYFVCKFKSVTKQSPSVYKKAAPKSGQA